MEMHLPEGFVSALKRRHNGAVHTKEEIFIAKARLDKLYKKYNKNKTSLESIDKYWDTANIESHFRTPIWYNAHSRRKRYIKNMEDSWRDMFYLLTNFDGNGREEFSKYHCISAEEVINDFKNKYLEKI